MSNERKIGVVENINAAADIVLCGILDLLDGGREQGIMGAFSYDVMSIARKYAMREGTVPVTVNAVKAFMPRPFQNKIDNGITEGLEKFREREFFRERKING